ncbi:MAG: dsDNA nuclease domain-containing protein, partial [Ferruginibacter sp.]
MPLSKLSIFSKDTDANAVLKGYEYQKLKTLETWLQNKINNRDEIIFCEYEDDIFQRNLNVGTSKFTQVKLYTSKNFSFNSEEIKKSIANFFMIFVQGEYSFDDVEFIFETNTSIA